LKIATLYFKAPLQTIKTKPRSQPTVSSWHIMAICHLINFLLSLIPSPDTRLRIWLLTI